MLNRTVKILFFLGGLLPPHVTYSLTTLFPVDQNGKQCNGSDGNTQPGGMFGYSIALSPGKYGQKTWMAVGRPWDSSVSIYYTESPINPYETVPASCYIPNLGVSQVMDCVYLSQPDDIPSSNITIATYYDCTTSNGTILPICYITSGVASLGQLPLLPSSVSWVKYNKSLPIVDELNYVYSDGGSSLNTQVSGTSWNSVLTWRNYTTYRWTLFGYSVSFNFDGSLLAVGIPGRYSGITPNNGHTYGGAVRLYQRNDAAGTYTKLTEITLTSLGKPSMAWDWFGHKVQFSLDDASTFLFISSSGGWDGWQWTLNVRSGGNTPNDTSRLGVHVLRRHGSTTTYSWAQFLPVNSLIAFGMLGLDFTTTGYHPNNFLLSVRDYIVTESVNGTGSGSVVTYAYNTTSRLFYKIQTIYGKQAGSTGTYKDEDYFGRGLSMAYDPISNLTNLIVAAPKHGTQLFTFALNNTGSIRTNGAITIPVGSSFWSQQSNIMNDLQDPISFFGGTVSTTSDGRYLFVADAVSSTGFGTVHIYRRYINGEKSLGFENVPIPTNIVNSDRTNVGGSPYFGYYRIGTFSKGTQYNGTFTTDQFGVSITNNWWLTVIGAPVEECVYTYLTPQSYNGVVDTTSTFSPVSLPTQSPNITFVGDDNSAAIGISWLYAVLGAIGGILIIGPLLIYFLVKRQKKILIQKLESMKSPATTVPLMNEAPSGIILTAAESVMFDENASVRSSTPDKNALLHSHTTNDSSIMDNERGSSMILNPLAPL